MDMIEEFRVAHGFPRTIRVVVAWGDVPTWVTAGAALLALIGAGFAYKYQAQQIKIQRLQLVDQQEATRLNAEAIAEQNRLGQREQADQVEVAAGPIDGVQAGVMPKDSHEMVHMVRVFNGSKRPIREVTVKVEAIPADGSDRIRKLADVWGFLETFALGSTARAQAFVPWRRESTVPVMRAGQTAGFVWDFTTEQYPTFISWVRFTDDADLHWQIDMAMHLEKLTERDW